MGPDMEPDIAAGSTVMASYAETDPQELLRVYEIEVEPAATPVTAPPTPTVATAVFDDDQTPPVSDAV